jgi:hypothetical protein
MARVVRLSEPYRTWSSHQRARGVGAAILRPTSDKVELWRALGCLFFGESSSSTHWS